MYKMNDIQELLKSGATVVDVRTFAEYVDGHLNGSINIPLHELMNRIEEVKKMQGVIVCCASGIRSNKAANILYQNGISCCDGGSWLNLYQLTSAKN
jgi:rhodanese-related sulfurtransferase